MAHLSLSLLGPFQVLLDGEPVIGFESDKVRALLAYLAVESDRPHRRETLAGLLWPLRPERNARRNLSQALFNLRHTIADYDVTPPFLLVTPQTLQFNRSSDHWLDVTAMAEMLVTCEKHCHRRLETCDLCLNRLQQAVALYRGAFLEGSSLGDSPAFEEWTLLKREGFHCLTVETLGHLIGCHERRGEAEQALQYARRQVELDPWLEEAHRQLMRVLALGGQRSAALAQYQVCCRTLAEDLGIQPEEETIALYERIRDGAELHARFCTPPHNLPTSLIPFVGREAELAEIGTRLRDPACRLLTLVGPGGSGKTRLALEAAAAQIHNFTHGVYLVSLALLQSAEAIVATVAQALGFSFHEKGKPQQQLLDYLRQRNVLLIMDSFEHLLARPESGRGDGAEWVTDVLRTAPDVTFLITSRARLNVRGEHLFLVAGMDFPPCPSSPSPVFGRGEPDDVVQYDAVRLFLDAARRVRPDLEPADDDLADVVRICCLVQGMPLSILLAAAWMEVLSPAEIAAQISGETGQGIDFLRTDWRGVPQRQRSLRAVFDHSWNLLTTREQEMVQRLSVFRSSFTHRVAQQVIGTSLHELMTLVDKSFLQRMPTGRYEMHELLRQYAAEKLDQAPATSKAAHDRHSAHYVAALQQWAADLKGARQQTALAEIEADCENARAAWHWAVAQGQVERLEQATEGLCLFYRWRARYQEGEVACRTAADALALAATLSGGELRVWARILVWEGIFGRGLGRTELARQLLQKSLTLLERPALARQDTQAEKAFALLEMGHGTANSNRVEARRLYEQSLALYRALGDRWGTANALLALGDLLGNLGACDEAKPLLEESLAIQQALGDQRGIADSLMLLSFAAAFAGSLEEAERLARKSIAIRQGIGDREGIASGLCTLGRTLLWLGKFAESHALIEESVAAYKDLGLRSDLTFSTVSLGLAKAFLGQYEQARAQGQLALALAQESDDQRNVAFSLLVLGWAALVEETHAEAQRLLQESLAIYREIGQWGELSGVLSLLGVAARGLGQVSQARRCLSEVLRTATETHPFASVMLVWSLPTIVLLLVDQGEKERAVELYALASRHPMVANSPWFEDLAGRHITAVTATLPSDVVAAAQARGQARDLQATVAELLVELGE